ncbi:hypothetical protein [Spiroplasma endosymbiont of Seladonia tumulorum]|uniref:hypothetical protein n=1 Tax=Spiroplasma endosymbiont of Seladonia tumulorum TaxID=3066321 RepID=UPI0030D03216
MAIIAINNSNQDNIISAIKNYSVFTDFYEIYGNNIKQVIDSEIKFTAADFKIGKIFKADKRTVASNKDLQDKGIFFVEVNGVNQLAGTVFLEIEII